MALLDVIARDQSCSVEAILALPELSGEFHYTAVLGDAKVDSFNMQVNQFMHLGFTDFKVKAGGSLKKDKDKLNTIISACPNARIRLDANNLWEDPRYVIDYIRQLECKIFAVEEPLQACDYAGMEEIARTLNIKIILDESFLRLQQVSHIETKPFIWIINVRV